jgi:hypothetical protein
MISVLYRATISVLVSVVILTSCNVHAEEAPKVIDPSKLKSGPIEFLVPAEAYSVIQSQTITVPIIKPPPEAPAQPDPRCSQLTPEQRSNTPGC